MNIDRPSDLIVFGEDWGGLPSSTQHLVHHLSKARKVLWINSIGLRRPVLNRHDVKRAWKKLTTSISSTNADSTALVNDNFHIVNPCTLPAPRSYLGRRLASELLLKQIRPIAKKAALKSPILWTSLPTAVDVAGKLEESALVYYCGDDFSALAGVDHATVAQRESELASNADLIMTASAKLAARFPATRTRMLPHGVDYPLFATPTARAGDLPNDGRPIAGFYGSISEWLDLELLHATITRLPEWHFVFIGKPAVDVSLLAACTNVHLLGERSHEQLPSYVQHWTASLLPFKNNPQIQACNPLKLREYLAAGRPIVSTPFPALAPYRHYIFTISDADGMIEALQQTRSRTHNEDQQQAVAEHTWKARAEEVSRWLDEL